MSGVNIKKVLRARKRCGHCDELLSLPVYKRHKLWYYNDTNGTWKTAGGNVSSDESDIDIDTGKCTSGEESDTCFNSDFDADLELISG